MRYYVSNVVGNGTKENRYRAEVGGSALIPTHRRNDIMHGHPRYAWALVCARETPKDCWCLPIGPEVGNEAELATAPVDHRAIIFLKSRGVAVADDMKALEVVLATREFLA